MALPIHFLLILSIVSLNSLLFPFQPSDPHLDPHPSSSSSSMMIHIKSGDCSIWINLPPMDGAQDGGRRCTVDRIGCERLDSLTRADCVYTNYPKLLPPDEAIQKPGSLLRMLAIHFQNMCQRLLLQLLLLYLQLMLFYCILIAYELLMPRQWLQ